MHFIIQPRKPFFALGMSFMLPGFGQLYNGDPNKAIWLFLGFALLSIPGVAIVALYLPNAWMMAALIMCMALTLGVWLYGMIDAWRNACRQPEYVLKPWQTGSLYTLVFILCNALALPLLINYVRVHQVESFRIPSTSMMPNLLQGDFIFSDKRYNCPGCKQAVQHGDLAIFVYPNNRTLYYIKRIIGLPGDHVQVKGNEVWVNGRSLTAETTLMANGMLITERTASKQWQVIWAPDNRLLQNTDLHIPAGQVFVLSDNRNLTHDSRSFGTVPLQDVVGKARQIWFSSSTNGVRWQRFGKIPE